MTLGISGKSDWAKTVSLIVKLEPGRMLSQDFWQPLATMHHLEHQRRSGKTELPSPDTLGEHLVPVIPEAIAPSLSLHVPINHLILLKPV